VKHGTEALVCLNQWVMDHIHEKEIRYRISEPSIIILVSETKYFGMAQFSLISPFCEPAFSVVAFVGRLLPGKFRDP